MRLHLLGQPHLVSSGKAIPLTANHSMILAWLTMQTPSAVPVSRVRLARAIWTDCADELGRKRLANSLYRLRQEHPSIENYLTGDSNFISLQNIWVDVLEFSKLLKSETPNDWYSALELYTGDLLADQDIVWLEHWRSQLHQTMLQGLRQAIKHCLKTADTDRALELTNRLIQFENWNEDAHTQLIRLYAEKGHYFQAINAYQILEKTLTQEFSSQPRPETKVFVEDLKRKLEQQTKPAQSTLVGRSKEWLSLTTALNAVKKGQGSLVLIDGDPGLGKTRLMLDLKSLATWHQISTLYGTASENTQPFAPLEHAMQDAKSLLEQTTPLIQKILEPLWQKNPIDSERSTPQVVAAAIERWLRNLEQPTLWLLDDLQWSGDLFWTVLKTLAKMTQHYPVMMVLSYRPTELQAKQLAYQTITEIRQAPQTQHFSLTGLSLDECTQITRGAGRDFTTTELQQLHRISAGNPLVFQELMLGNLAEPVLNNAFQNRFSNLDIIAREALEAASVLGKHLDLEVWAQMLEFQPPIEQLLESRFLHDQPDLEFQHDLTRVFVYEQMTVTSRQHWHERAFRVLKAKETRAVILANHAQEGNLLTESVHFYRLAASQALNLGAFQDVRVFVQQAVQNNHGTNASKLEVLFIKLIEMRLIYIESPNKLDLSELEILERNAIQAKEYKLAFSVMSLKLSILSRISDKETTLQAAKLWLEFTQEIQDQVLETTALTTIAVTIARSFHEPKLALQYALKAYQLSQHNTISNEQKLRILCAIINARIREMQLELALETLSEAETLFEAQVELVGFEIQIYNFKGAIAALKEDFELALSVFQKQLDISHTIGDGRHIDTTLMNLTETLKYLGRFDEAMIWAEELSERAPTATKLSENQYSYYFTDLAEVLTLQGKVIEAEVMLQPILQWLKNGSTTAKATDARRVMGMIYLAQGQFKEGLEMIELNLEQLNSNPENQIYNQLLAAELAWLAGFTAEATEFLSNVEVNQDQLENNHSYLSFYYTKYFIHQQPTDLERARFALLEFACQIKELERRNIMMTNAYYPKAILKAWQQQTLVTQTVSLPALEGIGTILVTWTLDSGSSDQQHFLDAGKAALRHHRMKRLMLEARAQGAKALQRHLASALGVSVRTIETDFALLQSSKTLA